MYGVVCRESKPVHLCTYSPVSPELHWSISSDTSAWVRHTESMLLIRITLTQVQVSRKFLSIKNEQMNRFSVWSIRVISSLHTGRGTWAQYQTLELRGDPLLHREWVLIPAVLPDSRLKVLSRALALAGWTSLPWPRRCAAAHWLWCDAPGPLSANSSAPLWLWEKHRNMLKCKCVRRPKEFWGFLRIQVEWTVSVNLHQWPCPTQERRSSAPHF